ncbi:hypothetical protein VTK73DRAFT_2077 [Phialemonium thermophilum]|uniref:Uncharacterized protein n=1 Tax=Phialemonium thermophilum TaxID=223376 RepID=A0ABR3VSP0_9PEZI
MLSSLRIATRQAALRRAPAFRFVSVARPASTWANVPQGPPDVSCSLAGPADVAVVFALLTR